MSESVMLELVDIKQEIFDPGFQEGSSDMNNEKPDSVHSEQKQPDDIELIFQQCDGNCETCQKYIRKLKEHVRDTHGVEGQSTRDPIRLELPYVNDSTLSNLEIKCEVEDVETMDYASETEMMLETGETNESESDADNRTNGTEKSLLQKQRDRESYCEEDPLKADTDERIANERIDIRDLIFNCNVCDKSFTVWHGLTQHKRTHHHTGVGVMRPYQCDKCDSSFARPDTLTKHKKCHLGGRAYECDECGKCFANSYKLTMHRKVHSEDRPYKCEECEQTFKRSDKLTQHRRIHTGVRPYKCNECDKTFSRSDNLSDHKKTHTGERPFQCDVCTKRFGRSSDWTRHKRTHNK